MRRLTGNLIFAFFLLLPLSAESAKDYKNLKTCPTGWIHCGKCPDGCVQNCPADCPPNKIVPLSKQGNTIYLMGEGAVVTCKENQTLHPIPSGKEGITYWTCGEGEGNRSQGKP